MKARADPHGSDDPAIHRNRGPTLISIYPLTQPSGNAAGWQTGLRNRWTSSTAFRWNRPAPRIAPGGMGSGAEAGSFTWEYCGKNHPGYILQRMSRPVWQGRLPIKFNGSLFVVIIPRGDHNKSAPMTAGFPRWGANTGSRTPARCTAAATAGDFDMMLPLSGCTGTSADNEALVKKYYHHEAPISGNELLGGLPFDGTRTASTTPLTISRDTRA